ncbi:triphosphoribosyl-dephospho-CoA synthase [Variovorax paradoxus]|uniref:triphosphoribosyl-dephospho-CoA synthase n=1 Tax=Variovorax paradoxus TaxID=34073 RepID=UPI002789E35C|nr:triphosphoribosyl-dephospho-CoA synthase [Variovorax paradoxus]MDQ0590685.1 triphosphoribosyl-dephospho-CoA synthase [Variovorax paradoxus]
MMMTNARQATIERARACFLRACWLDVAVRKPGNVSLDSPGHGMQASMFVASAQAAAGALFEPGLRVGARIEAAVAATWAVAGCNTNLGILLLCAPIALAVEQHPHAATPAALRAAVESVLATLDIDDARAAYRAIAHAHPGGLGTAPAEDVRDAPSVDLRAAMALAADRDLIARQYRDGFADLFALAFQEPVDAAGCGAASADAPPDAATVAFVQRLYLACLGAFPDSHIVRKHGERVAQTVMTAAQAWRERAGAGVALDADPGFAAWDVSLKVAGVNPGTSADFTVAALLLSGWIRSCAAPAREAANGWHGS